MSQLKAGFGRVDITPPLGTSLAGYYRVRLAESILDPLLASAVAFEQDGKRAAILSVDVIGLNQEIMARFRPAVAETIGTEPEAVFIHCTHTHLAPVVSVPGENTEYVEMLLRKLCTAAQLAAQDLAPATLSYTRGVVKDVAFIRRYRMKDGGFRTNPGWQNPDIDHPLGEPDENSSLLIIKREGAPEIGIVNFQVHPDVISGCKVSADYPKFVRDTYEKLIDNSYCMYINGAQGDTNHIDVRLGEDACRNGYDRSRHMGRKIAMSVIANYELALPISTEAGLRWGQRTVTVKHNKGRPDQIEEAKRLVALYKKGGVQLAIPHITGMERTTIIAEANRIVRLMDMPDEKELLVTAVAVGDAVFAGFPGEPFTQMGRELKENAKATLTIPACCANGYEGYYPVRSAYEEGGYEAKTVRYVAGTAEKLVKNATELVNSL